MERDDVHRAYLHRHEELRTELETSGLVDVDVLAVEGPLGHAVDLAPDPAEAITRAALVVELVERDPALLAASPHLLGVGRRP